MPLRITSLDELSTEEVLSELAIVRTLISEERPELDVRRGVVHDLVLYLIGQLGAQYEEAAQRLQRSGSLLEINASPELADTELVDRVMSNFGLTRQAGSRATGSITVVVSKKTSTTVARGARFVADGKEFLSTASYVARTDAANVQGESDRVLAPTEDGFWSFSIDVEAAEEGSASMLSQGDALLPAGTIVNFVRATAGEDFTGGQDAETNSQLAARQALGVAARTLSSRVNMSAALREAFPDVTADSIIGYGDAEMLRDQRGLFPISYGGRVDWHVRTRQLPQRQLLTMSAVLAEKTADGKGIWQISFDRDDAPGLYDIESVVPAGASETTGTLAIQSDVRGFDMTRVGGELTPDVTNAVEAAFSRYQTVVLKFKDDQTDTASLTVGSSPRDYDVTVRVMPQIADIQSYAGGRGVRHYGGDVLVKGPVPCFVSLSLVIEARPGASLPLASSIKDALAAEVNSLGFAGHLHASKILEVVHDFLPQEAAVTGLDMLGRILRPAGTLKLLRDRDVLRIPDEPANMVTSRTTAFFLYPDAIAIAARATTFPEI